MKRFRFHPVALATILVSLAVACSWVPWARKRPDPVVSVSGPAVYEGNCEACHAGPVVEHYAESLHSFKGVRCGQCHVPGGHPDYARPIADGKCGGCHQDQYQETLRSPHFGSRVLLPLDADLAARKALRADGFRVAGVDRTRFAGDETANELGGRLCVSCHFDEHRLGRRATVRADFCTGCHADLAEHYAIEFPGLENRCIQCHVRAGTTVNGQVVNRHDFTMGGGGATP